MISSAPPSGATSGGGGAKNHKVEGKNKKSLHQKQQQQQQQQTNPNHQCALQQDRQRGAPKSHHQQQSTPTSSSRGKKNSTTSGSPPNPTSSSSKVNSNGATTNVCSTLDDFSRIAQELKADINRVLAKQTSHQNAEPLEVVKLKNDILKLSGLEARESDEDALDSAATKTSQESPSQIYEQEQCGASILNVDPQPEQLVDVKNSISKECIEPKVALRNDISDVVIQKPSEDRNESSQRKSGLSKTNICDRKESCFDSPRTADATAHSDSELINALKKLGPKNQPEKTQNYINDANSKSQLPHDLPQTGANLAIDSQNIGDESNGANSDVFAPLNARLDFESKLVTLTSSLQKEFIAAPHLLDPVCRKLVSISDLNNNLTITCEKYQTENRKLILIKQKLENLCRELQKSNNAIRIESFDLIKAEQGKAKEQTTKIQSTLSGVIKLFDENQQRNMSLRQENQDLQTKLKSLLDHCDNWEKSIEAALKQRDIENRLLKTELAKANLLKNEEQEKFLGEKQELLQILSMMQEQQHRIEGQEAKLRSDLSSYASKYDECQAVISKGMNRFQTESKRMLKQIEKSKQDYKVLLTKYEATNKRTTQLLEEKQDWHRSMNAANKKIETLEKLCRALQERKEVKIEKRPVQDQLKKRHPDDRNSSGKESSKPPVSNLTPTSAIITVQGSSEVNDLMIDEIQPVGGKDEKLTSVDGNHSSTVDQRIG